MRPAVVEVWPSWFMSSRFGDVAVTPDGQQAPACDDRESAATPDIHPFEPESGAD
jgi:hypothetical protein